MSISCQSAGKGAKKGAALGPSQGGVRKISKPSKKPVERTQEMRKHMHKSTAVNAVAGGDLDPVPLFQNSSQVRVSMHHFLYTIFFPTMGCSSLEKEEETHIHLACSSLNSIML